MESCKNVSLIDELENLKTGYSQTIHDKDVLNTKFGNYKSDFCSNCKSSEQYEQHTFNAEEAKQLEEIHVHQVYEVIADHFSSTRYKPWPRIIDFLHTLSTGCVVVDVGCGNGKYLGKNKCLFQIGCDFSENLIKICRQNESEVFVADCLCLPLRSGIADVCICIAVLHHFSTKERRLQALQEIVRLLVPEGIALIYVWAMEQDGICGPSSYLKQSRLKNKQNYNEHCVRESSINAHINNISDMKHSQTSNTCASEHKESKILSDSSFASCFPVHCNRNNFEQQDIFVPWNMRNDSRLTNQTETVKSRSSVVYRYYHVFTQGELEALTSELNGVKIKESYYDKGNWCVLLQKLS